MTEFRFEKEWDEDNTSCEWHAKGRKILNRAIGAFNNWQINGFPESQLHLVEGTIEWARAQYDNDCDASPLIEVLDRIQENLLYLKKANNV